MQSPQPSKPTKRPRKNKTFLTVDSILKRKQKGEDGYVRAGRQVLEVMAQVQNEHIQKEIRDMHVNPGRSVSPILSEQAIRSKVDSLLHVSKDFQSKSFLNHPPCKHSRTQELRSKTELKLTQVK